MNTGLLLIRIIIYSYVTCQCAYAFPQGALPGEKIGKGGRFVNTETNLIRMPKKFIPKDANEALAVKMCRDFLSKLAIQVPSNAGIRIHNLSIVKPSRYKVSFDPYLSCSFDSKTNEVYSLFISDSMLEIIQDQPGYIRRSYDVVNVRNYASKLARTIYMPSTYKFSGMVDLSKDESSIKEVRVSFDPMPHGYTVKAYDEYAFFIDKRTGLLRGIKKHRPRDYKIESFSAKLSFDQAKAIAEPIAKKYQVGKYRPNELAYRDGGIPKPNLDPSALEYVCPNGRFRGLDYGFPVMLKLRLAWRLRYPRNEEIWIDAGDGKVLGGFYKDRP